MAFCVKSCETIQKDILEGLYMVLIVQMPPCLVKISLAQTEEGGLISFPCRGVYIYIYDMCIFLSFLPG